MFIIAAAVPLNGVGGQRVGRAAKANERNAAAVQFGARLFDGFQRKPKRLLWIGHAQRRHVCRRAHRVVDQRPFALNKLQRQPHALQRRQDVGKDNGCVQFKSVDGLHGHLTGQFRRFDDFQNVVGFTQFAVFTHIAARLPHEPHGRGVGRLAMAGLQKAGYRLWVMGHFICIHEGV